MWSSESACWCKLHIYNLLKLKFILFQYKTDMGAEVKKGIDINFHMFPFLKLTNLLENYSETITARYQKSHHF